MNTTLTTTNIGKSELKSLRSLAQKHNLKQVDFINHAIAYFKKTGINPADEIYSPREEISKLSHRVDQVIRFIKTQEEKKLTPLLDELIQISRKLNAQMENQVTSKHFNHLLEGQKLILEYSKSNRELTVEAFDKTQKTITILPSRLEEIKQILAISKELHDILYQSLMNRSNIKGFRYEDIQKFQQTIERYNNTIGE
jgi:virulence-associated protein VapD